MDLNVTTETFEQDDQSWLGSEHGTSMGRPVTLDISTFTKATHYPKGYIPSGTPIGRIAASGLYGPYGGRTSEVQQFDLGAASAGTFTISFDGETTAAIAFNANAATVQAALEELSNVDPGDIVVTGGPLPGTPVVLTFGGQYTGKNVPEITIGGGGLTGATVTISTTTAGGSAVSDGRENLAGFTLTATKATGNNNVQAVIFEHGRVVEANLPIAVDAAGKANVDGRIVFV